MVFFEDFKNVSKDWKIGITGLVSNITTRPGSHKGGWTRLLKCQLKNMGFDNVKILDNKDSLQDFQVIVFDLGAEYSGTLNMFGGLDEKVYKRLSEILQFQGLFFSWRNELPNLVETFKSRRTNNSTCQAFKDEPGDFLDRVQNNLGACQIFQHAFKTDTLLISDSHGPGIWDPSMMIERRDGRTLKGMVENKTIEKYLEKFPGVNKVVLHASSIDVRHHACRENNPNHRLTELQYSALNQFPKNLTVVWTHTMGIEDESRELPKTGYYRGTPFFGSWEDRNSMRTTFNSVLDSISERFKEVFSTIKYPDYFFDETGKLKFEVMENGGSVHISPEHYRWNLDDNCRRW